MTENQWLTDLQVTADELAELQANERPYGLLTERQREIIKAGRGNGVMAFEGDHDRPWQLLGPSDLTCLPHYTYRLSPSLKLPEPRDSREPFRFGEYWACPVFASGNWLRFKRPGEGDWNITFASVFTDFAGVCGAGSDNNPRPQDRLYDISAALAEHHKRTARLQIKFVLFRAEEDES